MTILIPSKNNALHHPSGNGDFTRSLPYVKKYLWGSNSSCGNELKKLTKHMGAIQFTIAGLGVVGAFGSDRDALREKLEKCNFLGRKPQRPAYRYFFELL